MRYYIIHQDKIYSVVSSEKDAKEEVIILIKEEKYTESQALSYIEIVKGTTVNFRIVFDKAHIEIIK